MDTAARVIAFLAGASLVIVTLASAGDQMILAGVQMSSLTPGWIFGA